MRKRSLTPMLLTIALAAAVGGCGPKKRPPVRIAVTPGVTAVGVVPHLVKIFRTHAGAGATFQDVAPAAIDSPVASFDIVITDDPVVTERLRTKNVAKLTAVFATNDFAIAGPRSDPAHVRHATSAEDAFRRIAKKKAPFYSAVDEPALRRCEAAVWADAGMATDEIRRYREKKGTAEAVLRSAAENHAYTLTDRVTFEEVRPSGTMIVFGGTPRLARHYTAILLKSPNANEDADWFMEWLMSYRGREAVDSFEVNDAKRLFLP